MSDTVVLKIRINNQSIKLLEPELSMSKKTGDHTRVDLRGLLNLQGGTGILTIAPEMQIQLFKDDAFLPFFSGMITYIDRKVETAATDPMERLTLKALSYTCLYDRERKNRSFQNKAESYETAINLIVGTYRDSGVIIAPEIEGKSLETLTVQYQETDWQFFKRLASRLSLPVAASHKTTGPKLYFGTVWSSTRHQITLDEAEEIEEISQADENKRQVYRVFRWTTEKTEMEILDIGDIISYKGIDFYIREIEIQVLGYEIQHKYLFGAMEAFSVEEIRNERLTGLSLPGTVTKVSGNRLQVGLDTDVLSVSDCWYSYATFYSLFFCMPEIGDRVYLYFPEALEAAAFVLNSVRVKSQRRVLNQNRGILPAMSKGNTAVRQMENAAQGEDWQTGTDVDITPYIDALADPADGKLIDLSVKFEDGTSSSLQEIFNEKTGKESRGGTETGKNNAAAMAGQNYDFETLANNDKVKVLSTKDGKKIILNDETGSIVIYLNDGTQIQLSGSDIHLVSSNMITFWADGKINLNSKDSIQIVAESEIEMGAGRSQIVLTSDSIKINSPDIRLGD